jgi:hypothetical protein
MEPYQTPPKLELWGADVLHQLAGYQEDILQMPKAL